MYERRTLSLTSTNVYRLVFNVKTWRDVETDIDPAKPEYHIFYYFCICMKNSTAIRKDVNSKGAAIFKKMLDDKKSIGEHLKNGGKISDLKDKFHFVKPVSIRGK